MTASVVVDISALREDSDASVQWLDGGFSSTTSWRAQKSVQVAPQLAQLDFEEDSPPELSWALLSRHRLNSHSVNDNMSNDISASASCIVELESPLHRTPRFLDHSPTRDRFTVIRNRSSRERRASERSPSRERRRRARSRGGISPSKSGKEATRAVDVQSPSFHNTVLCAHKFNQFKVPRPLTCSGCGCMQKPGATAYGCETCVWDLCEACYMNEKVEQVQADEDWKLPEVLSTTTTCLGSDCLDSQCSPGSSLSVASWSLSVTHACGNRSSFAAGSSHANHDQQGVLQMHEDAVSSSASFTSSASVRKECGLCKAPYSGFGGVCATCRKCGPTGHAHKCLSCNQFFQGFGTRCRECVGETSSESEVRG